MKIHFLGTGAADWDWSLPLSSEVRGSTCTLLDGKIMIDAGKTAWENLQKCNINPSEITHLLITHTHIDHFDPEAIQKIASAPGRKKKLHVYTSPEGVLKLDLSAMTATKLSFGKKIIIRKNVFEVLSANHMVENENESTFHFLITTPENKRLLYALDSGWMTSYTRNKLGRIPLDMIIWDATSGTHLNDWRFADHNDLAMIQNMRESLENRGLVNEKTVHIFNHIARTLWPDTASERKKAADKYCGILAEDGGSIEL